MKIDKIMLVRFALLLLALINQGLVMSGKSPLPFSDAQLEEFISYAFTIITVAWGFWKNNSFTKEAKQADEYLKELKNK